MSATTNPNGLPYTVADIDLDGDLILGTKPMEKGFWKYRICSATIRRHLPVWKTMLFGPWKESKPASDSEWVAELPEDPPYEMQVALYIIHGLVDKVPETLSVSTLFRLLIILNKYDMTRIVMPWCAKWVLPAAQNLVSSDIPKSLYIAWELGDESLFTSRLVEIAVKAQVEGDMLVFEDFSSSNPRPKGINLEAEDHLGPPDILDLIYEIRKAVIKKTIVPLNVDLEARAKRTPYCANSSNTYDQSICDAAVLGSIYRGMIILKGRIVPKESCYITESVVHLASWLFPLMAVVQTPHYDTQCSLKDKYSHHNTSLHDSIPEVVQQALKPSHRDYMASQRSKTGLATQPRTQPMQRYWKFT